MANKKDIGHAYKEQLETYKVSPHNRVWDRIEEELNKKNDTRAAYWKYSASILLLLLLSSAYFLYESLDSKPSTNKHIIKDYNKEHNVSNTSFDNNKSVTNINKENNHSKIDETNKNLESIIKRTAPQKNNYRQQNIDYSKDIVKNSIIEHSITLKSSPLIDIMLLTYSDLIYVPLVESDSKKKKTKNSKKFHIKTIVGTNHFGSLKTGSAIDETLKNNSKKSEITFNYGIALAYDLSKQSSISFGVQYTTFSNTTKASDSTNIDSTLKYSPGYQNISLSNATNSYPTLGSLSEIDFKQQLTYLEFPLQYYYTPSKSDLQLTFFGGVSFLALIDNDITAESSNSNSLKIGTANNLSKVSLSLNIGSGLNYVILNKLKLHIEPTFKYYINTYNRNNTATPYSINLNLGMSYKF